VPQEVEEGVEKKMHAAVIISAVFKELDKDKGQES
jgi:hypothetical protein